MRVTITSPPPPPSPPVEITITMSERDARIMTAYIGCLRMQDWENTLRENIKILDDILPPDFDIKKDLDDDIGYRFYDAMTKTLNKINR